ncbi:hypothetical protein ABVF61_03115 [Roseibium sp. HPY-6]|uniref:hypothetical protein n=1 Tax=Roseibium sp. HPY-6 TaxID=3229852 RepID=UPI00338DD750
MSRSKRLKTGLVVAALSFCAPLWLFWQLDKLEKSSRFVDYMPAHIEPVGVLMRQARIGSFHALIADACGINAIYISDGSARKIANEGLEFLNSNLMPRKKTGSRARAFEPWNEMTYMRKAHFGETLVASVFSCAGKSGVPARKIKKGLMSGKGFVSGNGGNHYYVFPDQKLFVQVFFY